MFQKCLFSFVLFLILSCNTELRSEIAFDEKIKKISIFDLMYQPNALEITLMFNVQEVVENRKSDKKHAAILSFTDKRGIPHKWNIKVKSRGVFRRYNCPEMPPLKINFKKSDLKKEGFSKFDDYKIVTHCIEDAFDAESIVFKEYLAYKYYNLITKNSFRVQLLKINYIDAETGYVKRHFGFMIEDFALLRDRVGAEKCETPLGIAKEDINREEYKKMALFQYMIGNADWSLRQVRNIKVMILDGKYVVVPYDFDFAGLVLAPYARVNADYKLTSLRQRVYLGFEDDLEDMKAVKKRFKKRKGRFKRKTKYFYLLHKDHRKSVLTYLDSFYKNMDNIQLPTVNNKT